MPLVCDKATYSYYQRKHGMVSYHAVIFKVALCMITYRKCVFNRHVVDLKVHECVLSHYAAKLNMTLCRITCLVA